MSIIKFNINIWCHFSNFIFQSVAFGMNRRVLVNMLEPDTKYKFSVSVSITLSSNAWSHYCNGKSLFSC